MDQYDKNRNLEKHLGRMIRNMTLQRMDPILQSGSWFPAADVYETTSEIYVYIDVSGVDPDKISILAEDTALTVSGVRKYPAPEKVSCIHQLEIERAYFERKILLPKAIDVARTTSEYHHGFLVVTMPLLHRKGKLKIQIT
ncbi:MAG: Hsp20/alpha crystallin family protein [Desulfobulbaceae bacterium]|nr:Hsp20/alpha crystallin family protein [Desulfobulbaceae bacterium]HIJ77850.1 Hsp20/alpha crystallin family protein [Deltaproteobacteria bacterium]